MNQQQQQPGPDSVTPLSRSPVTHAREWSMEVGARKHFRSVESESAVWERRGSHHSTPHREEGGRRALGEEETTRGLAGRREAQVGALRQGTVYDSDLQTYTYGEW